MFDMIIPPTVPLMQPNVSVVATASASNNADEMIEIAGNRTGYSQVYTACQDVEYGLPDSADNSFSPFHRALLKRLGAPADSLSPAWLSQLNPKATLLEAPKHGKIIVVEASAFYYRIIPDDGYEGTDRVVYEIEAKGQKFKTVLNLLVRPLVSENYTYCNDIKFDSLETLNSLFAYQNALSAGALDVVSSQTSYVITSPSTNTVTYTFTDLPGTSVGETTGEDSSASIVPGRKA